MEELQKKHRQEQKDLQARITQKKKAATKKTRKGVNDECVELERQLKEKHTLEAAAAAGDSPHDAETFLDDSDPAENESSKKSEEIINSLNSLTVSNPTPSINGQGKKPNRQKARLARRAAEQEAAAEEAQKQAVNLPNLRDQERQSMRQAYLSRGLEEHEIRSDGHCLYAAVADQLQSSQMGLEPQIKLTNLEPDELNVPTTQFYRLTRRVAAAYISQNPDYFEPFLEEPLDNYVKTIRETGEWGGHLEILALAKAYGVDINVLQGDGKVQKIECGSSHERPELWLAYYRHSFGMGEHYNSLRKAG